MEKKDYGIGFWRKESKNLMSHGTGLTPEQVEMLQALKQGDRLILWDNNNEEGSQRPAYALKVYKAKPKQEDL